MSASPTAQRVVVRGALVALGVVALFAILYLIANNRPTPDSWYPKCFSYLVTGTHCPGCGTGRALHFALNGDFEHAARANVFSVVLLPTVAVVCALSLWRWVTDRPHPEHRIGALWIRLLFVLLIAFWIGRNIPAYPFTLLAPQELEPVGEQLPR